MDASQTKTTRSDATASTDASQNVNKIDRNAPAGSKNSLGAESVRDGRPSSDDDIVEAIDEEGPGTTAQTSLHDAKARNRK
ncbi:MAG TPA: hypothetical protein VNU92_09765 [Edaphobacter sp.]|jgi:hypothetical protein|nr:hypothetical protein [Edaphobacter sp.]